MAEEWIDATPVTSPAATAGGDSDWVDAEPVKQETSLWGAVKTVPAGIAANVVEAAAGAADIFGAKETASNLRQDVKAARTGIQEAAPVDQTSWKGATRSALESIGTQLPLMAVGALTGGATLPLVGMSVQAGLQKMSDLTGSGVPYAKALPLAGLSGGIEGITEKIPFGAFLNIIKGNKRFASNFAKMLISEQLGEQAASLGDTVIDLIKPNESWDWQKYKDTIVATAKTTAVQSSLMGGLGAGVNRLRRNKEVTPPPVVKPASETLAEQSLPPTPETATLRERNRRNRNVEELAKKKVQQEELVQAAVEAKLDEELVVIPEETVVAEEAPIILEKYSQDDLNKLDTIIQSKGSIAEVDKVYKGKSKIDVYAREKARELFGSTPAVQEEQQPPSVQNLNEGQISAPLVVEQPILSPERLAQAKAIQSRINATAGHKLLADRIFLKENKYTQEALDKMTPEEINSQADKIREELEPNLPAAKEAKLTEIEAKTRALANEVRENPDLTPEQLARVEEIISLTEEAGIKGVELRPSVFDLVDLDTGLSKVSVDQIVKQKNILTDIRLNRLTKKPSEKAKNRLQKSIESVVKEETLAPEEEAKKWKEMLDEEGMPEEVDLDSERMSEDTEDIDAETRREQEYALRKDEVDEEYLTPKERSDNAKRKFDAVVDYRQVFNGDTEARNTIVRGYKFDPETRAEGDAHYAKLQKAEAMAEGAIPEKRPAFNAKTIAAAVRKGIITKEQAKYIEAILTKLKKQPDMTLEFDPLIRQLGVYELAGNILTLKNPKATAHEVMHWAFYNVLTGQERLAYYQDYLNSFYGKGPKGRKKLRTVWAATSDKLNASRNPSEMFAARGSDVANMYKLSDTERSLFAKIFNWFQGVKDKLGKIAGVKLEKIDALFNKVMAEERQFDLPELDEMAPPIKDGSEKLDMLGLDNLANRVSSILQQHRIAKANRGAGILAEVKGTDDTSRGVFVQDLSTFRERLNKNIGSLFRSPEEFARGTINEKHVYNLNRDEQYIASMFDEHNTTITDAEMGLSKEERLNIRKVLEKKIPGSVKEQAAAEKVRVWLDSMKAKYKKVLMKDYAKNLNKTEFNALLDIITGSTVDQLAIKYPRLNMETVKEIAEHYQAIDSWGLDDYVPNVEKGRFKVVTTAYDKDGKPYTKLVAIGLSEKDAARKAVRYLETHPDSNSLMIDTDFKVFNDDKTSVSSKQYYAMMGKLSKEIQASIDGIDKKVAKEMAAKTMSKKFVMKPTHAFSEFLQPRRDILQGEEDIFPVLRSYAYSLEKKMALDPTIDLIKKDLNKMTPEEREFILDLVEDVKGRYTKMNKIVDKLFGTYGGYNRLVGSARKLEANIKLGYRPVAASINFASGQLHTWVKVGAKAYTEALQYMKTEEGKKLLKDVHQFLGTTLASGEEIQSKTPAWKPLGLFQMAEPLNREVSVTANYLYAKNGLGLSEEASKQFAIRANWAQQFTYNIANLPKIMRGPTGRLLTQFKPYLVKELEFMSNLSGKEWTRYLVMQLALGGPRGYVMVMKSLPVLAGLGLWSSALDDLEEWMNKNIPIASRGIAALPSLIKPEWGVDVSAAASFQFPQRPLDFVGPALSDLYKLWTNVVEPMSTYGFNMEDASKALDSIAVAKYWNQLMKFVLSDDDWIKDRNRNKLYEVPSAIPYIIQSVMGTESVDLNRIRSEEGILARRSMRINGIKTRLTNEFMKHILDGSPIPQDLVDNMMKNGLTMQTIKNRIKISELPPDLRNILKTEVRRRPEVAEMFPGIEDY